MSRPSGSASVHSNAPTATTLRPVAAHEGITVDQALAAYTVDAAHACHRDGALGRIAEGHHADFALLADDPRTVETSRIGDIEIMATLVAGQVAHGTDILAS